MSTLHPFRDCVLLCWQWAVQQGAELSQEQYAAMTPEQQAAYWAQWQYYAQYYSAPDSSSAQQYAAAHYQPYQASWFIFCFERCLPMLPPYGLLVEKSKCA
jgi:hypothetical protein